MELKVSKPILNPDNFCPFIEIEFKTKMTLDNEMFLALSMHGENIYNVLACEYRDALEANEELKKLIGEK
jgi:hypothetical protein